MEGGRSSWTESKTPLIVLLVRRADCCLLPSIQSVNFRESLRTISPRLISSHSKRGPVPDLFEQLKQKYQSVLGTMQKEGAQLRTLHLDGNQLCLKATATSEAGRNPIWKAIKASRSRLCESEARYRILSDGPDLYGAGWRRSVEDHQAILRRSQ
jgi:hypothetical protein